MRGERKGQMMRRVEGEEMKKSDFLGVLGGEKKVVSMNVENRWFFFHLFSIFQRGPSVGLYNGLYSV